MAKENNPDKAKRGREPDIEDIKRYLDVLDQRLDNIDSMVTAVAERVMNQPVTLLITCPNCGKSVEINIIGQERPTV